MPMDQQDQNLLNEMQLRHEEREAQEHREEEREREAENGRESVASEEGRPSIGSDRSSTASTRPEQPQMSAQQFMAQGYSPEQARWMEGVQAFQRYKAQREQDVKNMRDGLAQKAKEEKEKDDEIKKKREKRNQQYDQQIERGGAAGLWAALKKFFMQVIGDMVVDAVRGAVGIAKAAGGLAMDAGKRYFASRGQGRENDINTRGLAEQAEMLEFMAKRGYLGNQMQQNAPQAQQNAPQMDRAPQMQQTQPQMSRENAQPQMGSGNAQPQMQQPQAEQPGRESVQPQPEQAQPGRESVQSQPMPHPRKEKPDYAEQRDSIAYQLNGLDNMCRSASLITGSKPSRRDLSVALACMHDPAVSGMSEGQSRFESEKIMKFLSGEKLNPQDGPINQDLLRKGLDAARQPGALEREGFLGAMHNMSRVISRAPSLDAPHRMAAGDALNEIAKEYAQNSASKNAVFFKDTAIRANVDQNESLKKIVELRGAITCANIYRQGRQALHDELDRAAEMQQHGMNMDMRTMRPESIKAIATSEMVNRNLAQRMTQERIALNRQQNDQRRAEDIAKMPMPNPMTMAPSDVVMCLGKNPHLMDSTWAKGISQLKTVREMQGESVANILDDMEKNKGAVAERIAGDIREQRETRKTQREEEKRREREQEKQKSAEKQNGVRMA